MNKTSKLLLGVSAAAGLTSAGILTLGGRTDIAGFCCIGALACLATGGMGTQAIKQHVFTIWIILAVAIGMFFPQYFLSAGDFKLTKLIVPLIQWIMFSMGTEMSLKDFESVFKSPKAVLIGLLCHFTIMPLAGFSLAVGFGLESEIAAGIVLMGCVPSGVTSNVLAFIAKANLPLSVTIAASSTLIAPLATPLLMKILAGQFVEINFVSMVIHIAEIIILPIALGLFINRVIRNQAQWIRSVMPLSSMTGVFLVVLLIVASGRDALSRIGPLLFAASMIHHSVGYFLGYWSGRLLKLDEATCRTLSLEVGMQNAGLASGIALQMGKVATVGLASAIAAPWMTISGSLLANWWRNRSQPF